MQEPVQLERVAPDQVRVGDILVCRRHDDQLEWLPTRVMEMEMDAVPGVYQYPESTYRLSYEYRVHLTCRHINLKRLDAAGGVPYSWSFFNWNQVTRYVFPGER